MTQWFNKHTTSWGKFCRQIGLSGSWLHSQLLYSVLNLAKKALLNPTLNGRRRPVQSGGIKSIWMLYLSYSWSILRYYSGLCSASFSHLSPTLNNVNGAKLDQMQHLCTYEHSNHYAQLVSSKQWTSPGLTQHCHHKIFFGNSHSAPTPSIHTTQLLGLGVTNANLSPLCSAVHMFI